MLCYRLMKRLLTMLALGLSLGDQGWGQPMITEFMAINGGELIDGDGEPSDWIEIFNTGDDTLDLGQYALTDDPDALGKWPFPAGQRLQGHGYLIVFASGKDGGGLFAQELHTNFKLSGDGEYLALVKREEETIVHAFDPGYPVQRSAFSYGIDATSGDHRYYRETTPGQPNAAGRSGFTADPTFSATRGFFSEAFELSLTSETEGARIRYSTDGSVPSLFTGRTYTGPVVIDGTTTLRAHATGGGMEPSNLITHTYIFVDEVLQQRDMSPPGSHWDTEMDPDVVNDASQTWSVAQALTSIPALSLVASHGDLFGGNGIYKRPERRNYDVPCSAEYFFPKGYDGHPGGDGFAIDCGLTINGNYSRLTHNPKHSFRLKFKDIYGKSKLRYPLFPERGTDTFDTITIRTGHNQGWATDHPSTQMMRNQFSRDLQALDPSHFIARGHWVHLYLNGLYWGLYNFHERPDHSFAAENYGGDKEEYDAFKGLRTGGSSQAMMIAGNRTAWAELFRRAARDLTVPENYRAVLELVDLDQLIDYTIGLLYTGDLDGPTGLGVEATQPKNFYAVRRRHPTGRFRFFRWDSEFTLQNANEDVSERRGTENPAKLHFELRKNPEYRMRFADRVQRHFFHDGLLTPENAAAFYLSRLAFIDKAIVAESARWGDSKRDRPYTRDVDWVRETNRIVNHWFPRRTQIVLDQFIKDGLYPEVRAATFTVDGDARYGGFLDEGARLAMSSPDSTLLSPAVIYYTLDGGDPRGAETAEISPEAIVYESPIALPDKVTGAKPARHRDLVVSEIHYRPMRPTADETEAGFSSRQEFEFIELKNVGESAVDLTGTRFTVGIRFEFEQDDLTRLPKGDRLILVNNRAAFEHRYGDALPVAGAFSGSRLSDDGERLVLLDRDGGVLLDFTYNDAEPWPRPADGRGSSLVLSNPSPDSDLSDPRQWRTRVVDGDRPTTGYDAWVSQHFPSADPAWTAFGADPDGDGFVNGIEFALSSDPSAPAILPKIIAGSRELIYRRNAAFPRTHIGVEQSSDLIHWVPLESGRTASSPLGDGEVIDTVDLKDQDAGRSFARLRVRLP